MAKATRTYSQWRLEKLSDPVRAARYLNAAKKESKESFLYALKNVIQANQVAKVAREAGISRESVYRSFSAEGNPTFDTLADVLQALDIDFSFSPIVHVASGTQSGGAVDNIKPAGGSTNLQVDKSCGTGNFIIGSMIRATTVNPQNTGADLVINNAIGNTTIITYKTFQGYANVANNGAVLPIPSVLPGNFNNPEYLSAAQPVRSYGIEQERAGSCVGSI